MRINICGDFTTMGEGMKSVLQGTALSTEIVKLFQESDLNIVNFESPVVADKNAAIVKSGPNISTSASTVEYLSRCNVNLVTLANNHFFDYGKHGVTETINALEANSIDHVGGGIGKEEVANIYYYEKDGIQVAVLNYCETEFSVSPENDFMETGDGIPIGSNQMNPINVYYDLQQAKTDSDFIIVICHGGHEGYRLPSPRMKKWYRFFIDSGANIVCNHHQHCFSGYENYNGGTIYYGLGNFFFDDFRPKRHKSSIWNYGYIVSIYVDSNGVNSKTIPYKQCLDAKSTVLLNNEELAGFTQEFEELSDIIPDSNRIAEEFKKWCEKQVMNVKTNLSPYNKRIFQALCRHKMFPSFLGKSKRLKLYNMFRCESHRDVAIEVLREKNTN